MWTSKDVALVIIFAVTAFVYQGIVGQIPLIITGIQGIGYFFAIGGVIIFGTAFLIFEGKRWRFFVFTVLYSLLMLLIFVNLGSFHILRGVPMVLSGSFKIECDPTSEGKIISEEISGEGRILINGILGFYGEVELFDRGVRTVTCNVDPEEIHIAWIDRVSGDPGSDVIVLLITIFKECCIGDIVILILLGGPVGPCRNPEFH